MPRARLSIHHHTPSQLPPLQLWQPKQACRHCWTSLGSAAKSPQLRISALLESCCRVNKAGLDHGGRETMESREEHSQVRRPGLARPHCPGSPVLAGKPAGRPAQLAACVWPEVKAKFHFLHIVFQLFQHYLFMRLFFPFFFLRSGISVCVWSVSGLSILFHWFTCLFLQK